MAKKKTKTEKLETTEIIEENGTKEISTGKIEDIESLPYQVMDEADSESLASFFKGASSDLLDKWVYSFPQDGKNVQGLSWVGSKEVCVWLSKLPKGKRMIISECPEYTKVVEVSFDNMKYIDATTVFEDLDTGRKVSGNARQSYLRKNGGKINVEFVPRQALSKAQRNAIQKLIPSQTILAFIDYAKTQGKVQTLALPKDQTALLPDEMAKATPYLSQIEELNTVEELREYFKTIKKKTELGAKILLSITTAIQIKAQNIKNKEAKDKIKGIIEKEKEAEKEAEKLAEDAAKALK
jgi:hypothetical protein